MGDMEIEIIKSIKIKGLKFSYNNQKIFDGLDFFIGTGEHLIIKGDNGSGKTTLSKLITGLYKDYDGIITINDIDLKKINLYSLRKQIFICEQFPLIFNTSVYENIEYFVSKEQEHRIDDIISILSLDDIKYKQTGENGKFLSGGQIQKISIARAMLSGAALIILDEPDTALDTETHNKVMNYFNNLKIMLIIISHNDNWSVPKTSKVINL